VFTDAVIINYATAQLMKYKAYAHSLPVYFLPMVLYFGKQLILFLPSPAKPLLQLFTKHWTFLITTLRTLLLALVFPLRERLLYLLAHTSNPKAQNSYHDTQW